MYCLPYLWNLLQANFRDMGEHRVVSRDEAMMFVQSLGRPDEAAPVRYAECSMKQGFGLTHLHKFLSVPFLQLQVLIVCIYF